ncbi:hypothetical protein LSH36_1g01053 [Paralvinella palmiformis]|uniref:rRNA biogenesis protein RRP36 n=1 Tax=Paralvinella palmiformis TaxID=53620 RepID=A0AAD9KHH9_9ANNE|nr:hypothetical protein LSH36_1g01053 [Paralvinella palmiformis]
MTSKKLKKHLTDSKSFDSNSDSDEIEEFTTKFMSHMKKISVEKIMNLNKVDSDSEMTTDDDDDSECDDSDIVSNSLTSCDRDLTSYGRFIESQKLADDEEEEDDDDDEGDSVSSHDESESGISSDEESKNEIHQEAGADNSKDEEDSISDTGGTSSDDSSQKSKHRKHLVPNEGSSTEEDSGRTTEKDPFKQLQKELADMPFTELQKLKEKIGIKAYNQAVFGSSTGRSGKKVFKRENKNRPTEMSSKRPVPRHREVIQVKKRVWFICCFL